jgi:predicted ester cyclase
MGIAKVAGACRKLLRDVASEGAVFAFEPKKSRMRVFDIAARNEVRDVDPADYFCVRHGWKFVTSTKQRRSDQMSKEADNKAVVGRWFTHFWGKTCDLAIIDELAAPDMLLQYSLHAPRRGREDIRAFMNDFRKAFPDLNFWGTADLIAEGDYVVGQWEGGGTHTGPAFSDFLMGSLPPATGRKMHFTGTTVLRIDNGKIAQEIGLDDGVKALTQLGLMKAA